MNIYKLLAGFSVILSLCACNSAPEKFDSQSLAEGAWVPVYLVNQDGAKMPDAKRDGEQVYIDFHSDGRFNGMSGNNLFGRVANVGDDSSFSAQNVYSTRRMGAYSDYEMKFLDALNKANKIELNGDILKLMLDKSVLLEFKRTSNPTRN